MKPEYKTKWRFVEKEQNNGEKHYIVQFYEYLVGRWDNYTEFADRHPYRFVKVFKTPEECKAFIDLRIEQETSAMLETWGKQVAIERYFNYP